MAAALAPQRPPAPGPEHPAVPGPEHPAVPGPEHPAVPGPEHLAPVPRLVEQFERGLAAPICLTWELTYACNLACVHCLSSSGRRDPRELTTAECRSVIDTLERMQVFYVNVGGGEPTVRPDFWELVDYATAHHVGVKFSTNGIKIDPGVARRLAASDYVDVQISLDGATAEVNDAVRGAGSYATAIRAMRNLTAAGFEGFKLSVVMTRHNVGQLDQLKALADAHGAQLRLTRLRPSGRGADSWPELHLTAGQQRKLYDWLVAHGEQVLTGDSFFHLAPYGGPLPGLNLCGAGRVVCLIDPVGDVYACPFAIHEEFLAGSVRQPGGFEAVWRDSELFAELRRPVQGEGGRAGPASSTTRAAVAAWPPSSSPGCPWTAPTPSACGASAPPPSSPPTRPLPRARHLTTPITVWCGARRHARFRSPSAPGRRLGRPGAATRARWPASRRRPPTETTRSTRRDGWT